MLHNFFLSVVCFAASIGHGIADVAVADKFLQGTTSTQEAEAVSMESVKNALTSASHRLSSSQQDASMRHSAQLLREGPLATPEESKEQALKAAIRQEAALDEHLAEIAKRHGVHHIESKKTDISVVRHGSLPEPEGNVATGAIASKTPDAGPSTHTTPDTKKDQTSTSPDAVPSERASPDSNNGNKKNDANIASSTPKATATDTQPGTGASKVKAADKANNKVDQVSDKPTAKGNASDQKSNKTPDAGKAVGEDDAVAHKTETGQTSPVSSESKPQTGGTTEANQKANQKNGEQEDQEETEVPEDSKPDEKAGKGDTNEEKESTNNNTPEDQDEELGQPESDNDGRPREGLGELKAKQAFTAKDELSEMRKSMGIEPKFDSEGKMKEDVNTMSSMLDDIEKEVDRTAEIEKNAADVPKKVQKEADQRGHQKKAADSHISATSPSSLLAGFDTRREDRTTS